MSSFLSRIVHGVTQIPHRILGAVGWAQMEPAGLGVPPASADVDETEARRREDRERERKDADEERPPDTGL